MRSRIRLLLGLAMSALVVTPAAPADDTTVYDERLYVVLD